jgi:AAA domain
MLKSLSYPDPTMLLGRFATAETQIDRACKQAHGIFTPSSPVLAAHLLYGRERFLERIEQERRTRGRAVVLFGAPASGKTSLLKIVEEREKAYYCSADQYHTWGSIVRSVLEKLEIPATPEEIHHSSTSDKSTELGIPGTSGRLAHSSETRQVTRNPFTRVTPDEAARQLADVDRLVIIDAFENLKRAERVQFTELIKKLSDHRSRLTLLLAGTAREVKDLIVNFQRVESLVIGIQIPALSRADLARIVDEGFVSLGIEVSSEARERILTRANGLAQAVHEKCLDCVYALRERIRYDSKKELAVGMEECELAESYRPTVG